MFTQNIIAWYNTNGRDLPWRDTKDPYKIWISEVILQQTRVVQGYEYYLSFIERFPDVTTLAEATEMEVLKYWQGLGYYSRARNLHAAAQSIAGKSFPSTYKEIVKLKGVGDYTAAAISSFAFDLPYAVVDGNVFRVLSRYFGIETPIDSGPGKKEFTSLAQELLDKRSPGLYNQAIMDFGAIQCTPKQPLCSTCPLSDSCVALSENKIDVYPIKKGTVKVRTRFFSYFYLSDSKKNVLIHKRTDKDIWKNMYELPLIETTEQMSLAALISLKLDFLENLDIVDIKTIVVNHKHVLSHQKLHTSIYKVEVTTLGSFLSDYLIIKEEDIDLYPIPRIIHKFLPKILE